MDVLTGQAATDVLASADFDVVPYAGRYQALSDRLGVDFDAILFTLRHLPLGLRGVDHADHRADVAKLIAERRAALRAALPSMIARWFGCLSVPGRHELMAAAVEPCVDAMIAELAGIDPDLGESSLVSRVFSQKIGVAQRRRLNGELARLIARLRKAFPGDSDVRIGSRVTLVVLGRDAMIGTLAFSLKAYFDTPEAGFARVPSHTGVPYIDRQAVKTARGVAEGTILRCLLQSLEGGTDADRQRFFGAGAHVCLGRVAAMDLFQGLAGHLAGLSGRIRVEEFSIRDCDVFAVLQTLWVKVEG